MFSNPKVLIKAFSAARMNAYLPLTPNGTDTERLKLARWDDLVCNYIWGEIRTMEIMLRNVIAQRLSEKLLSEKNDDEDSENIHSAKWWEDISFVHPLGDMLLKASAKLRKQNKGTEGHFIAELPMGFWCGCLVSDNYFRDFWKANLKKSFPNIVIEQKTKRNGKKQKFWEAEKDALKQLQQKADGVRNLLRNLIGHHHPMVDKIRMIERQLNNLYYIMDCIEPEARQAYSREEELREILKNPPFVLKKKSITLSS